MIRNKRLARICSVSSAYIGLLGFPVIYLKLPKCEAHGSPELA